MHNLNNYNLEDYLKRKIPKIRDIVLKLEEYRKYIRTLEVDLETALKEEIEDLKSSTGLQHIANKSKALSKVSNKALLGDNTNAED
jgi:hypothetical protein